MAPPSIAGVSHDHLVVRGAREHNLKDVSIELPRDSLVVFTGLSGSGKSSLAFDTIFAEGQRRYVESLSAYARQFLGQMDKPDVDFIEGLSPAVSIDQKSTNRNPRSTVGTITEVYDYLRLLFARAGRPHCPVCGEPITRQTPAADRRPAARAARGHPLPGARPGGAGPQGRVRRPVRASCSPRASPAPGSTARSSPLTEPPEAREAAQAHHRRRRRPARRQGGRRPVVQAAAHRLGRDRARPGRRRARRRVRRPRGGRPRAGAPVLREDGLPQRPPAVDGRDRAAHVLVQQPVRRLPRVHRHRHRARGRPRPHRPRRGPQPRRGRHRTRGPAARGRPTTSSALMAALADDLKFSIDTPWRALPQRAKDALLHGENHKVHVRYKQPVRPRAVLLHRVRGRRRRSSSGGTPRPTPTGAASATRATCARCPCPVCKGARLKPESLAVLVGGQSIADVSRLAIADAARFLDDARASPRASAQIAERVLKEINARLGFLLDVGLDYLSPRPPGRHPVRRRGPAHPARHPDRLGPGRRALRARRAEHRPAPARQPPADRDPHPAARPRQHAHRRRARRRHHPHRRLGRRHRPGRGRARRPGRALRHRRRPAHPPRLAHRRVPLRPRARSRRRRCAGRSEKGREVTVVQAHASTTCDEVTVSFPLGDLVAVTGVSRLGQVHAGQRHPLQRAGQQAQRRPARARPAQDASRGSSTSTRSCTSTRARSAAPRGPTRPPTPASSTTSASSSPTPPRRRCAATSRAASRSTSRAAAARPARATARSRSR